MENKNTEDRIDEMEKRIKSMQTREYAIIGAVLLVEVGLLVLSKRIMALESDLYKLSKPYLAKPRPEVVPDLVSYAKPSRSEAPVENVSRETIVKEVTDE